MKRELIYGIAALAVAAGTLTVGASARADSVEEFYRGKTVELIVGYSAGGGYDRYARVLARHMGRFIPGNPTIVVKNMPGAGSLVAANHLYTIAPKDGTAFGTFGRGLPMAPLLFGDKGIEFEATKFNWIGSLNNEVSVCFSWHTSPIKTWRDLQEKEMITPGTGAVDDTAVFNVMRNVLGARLRVVTGYSGSSEMLLAVERGEVDGFCGASWSSLKGKKSDWIRDGKMNMLAQMAMKKHPDLPDVPLVMDLAKTDEQRRILALIFSRQTMGRPFAAPPGVPEERVQALRDAFQAMLKDPEFLAEAKKSRAEVNAVSGEEIDELLRSLYATPNDVLAKTRAAIKG